jgi:predicted transcriptional regulator of viral defense system
MASRRSTLEISKRELIEYFTKFHKNILTYDQIEKILVEQRKSWRLANSVTVNKLIKFLIAKTQLREIQLNFPSTLIPNFNRFCWGNPSPLAIAASLKPEYYFSHYTAMSIHRLTEQMPKIIYLTWEQPEKARNIKPLEQRKIDWAFSQNPRISQNFASLNDHKICILYGMHTGGLGIIRIEGLEGEKLRVTNVERTLIDITVRPFYAGGVFEVLKAFKLAKDQVSVNKLATTLKRIGYVYPYHQAIGFYLERSGAYKKSSIDIFRRMEKNYDFYLTYQIKDKEYSKDWRLFYPKGL